MKVLNGWSDRKMWRVLNALPIGVVFFDLIYGFVLNVLQGLDLQRAVPDLEGVLAVTPDIAFNSLQIVANGGMAAVVCFGLAVVFLLNRSVRRRQVLEIGVFQMLGLVAVLAFSAPSVWEWANALPLLLKGADVVNTGNARYVLTALCMPFPAVSCVIGLVGRFRLQTASGRAAKSGGAGKADG
ncbi:TPA: hypothetical protein ACJME7_002114 [Neisseria meningitidis]|uniref:hypothetical protein n=1 Tax=Neisseria meningitidis TaxID=487 RepID=UPI000412AED5|nr:hypothetical protein [Neisseria meningitidis]ATL34943.1 hypothetical protein CQR35_11200 [Neisseria meningitidis]ATL35641.1 hypothetical protein CQR34_01115 [Neisseria meningitidis]KID53126.1 membrane protein [Neisseria meningitidis LNP27256]MCI3198199.1 hypothetical protein [Neisseria meningitidis]RNJ83237.1 hypothetical protein COI37_12385 [Neisseria meningitidis]